MIIIELGKKWNMIFSYYGTISIELENKKVGTSVGQPRTSGRARLNPYGEPSKAIGLN